MASIKTKPVLCILTAENCGHCRIFRKPTLKKRDANSNMSGAQSWSQEFFGKLMFATDTTKGFIGDPHYKVYNVHVPSTGSRDLKGATVTEFVWSAGKVEMVERLNPETLVPLSIFNYITAYPTYAIFDGAKWDSDIHNKTSKLYGYVMNKSVGSLKVKGRRVYGVKHSKRGDSPLSFAVFTKNKKYTPPGHGPVDSSKPPGLSKMQSVMSDRHKRGNPRGKARKDVDLKLKF